MSLYEFTIGRGQFEEINNYLFESLLFFCFMLSVVCCFVNILQKLVFGFIFAYVIVREMVFYINAYWRKNSAESVDFFIVPVIEQRSLSVGGVVW